MLIAFLSQAHGLSVERIVETNPATLNGLISKVGFHNNKTKFILQATQVWIWFIPVELRSHEAGRVMACVQEPISMLS